MVRPWRRWLREVTAALNSSTDYHIAMSIISQRGLILVTLNAPSNSTGLASAFTPLELRLRRSARVGWRSKAHRSAKRRDLTSVLVVGPIDHLGNTSGPGACGALHFRSFADVVWVAPVNTQTRGA